MQSALSFCQKGKIIFGSVGAIVTLWEDLLFDLFNHFEMGPNAIVRDSCYGPILD